MQPITTKMEAQYGGPSSSKDINEFVSNACYDITQLFNVATEHAASIDANKMMLQYHNAFLQKKIQALEALLDSLQASIGVGNKTLVKSFASGDGLVTVEGYESTWHNSDYNVLHVPTAQQVSKLYLVDSAGSSLVPKTLQYTLYESTSVIDPELAIIPAELAVADARVINALDGNENTFWLRTATYNSTVPKIYMCLEIVLPTNIINHTRANGIYIDPIPEYGLTLDSIKYRTFNDWSTLPGFTEPIKDMTRTFISFPTRDIAALRIYFSQPNWILVSGQHLFPYGFHRIEVNYINFKAEENRIRVRFDIPDDSKQFVSITDVIPVFAPNTIDDPSLVTIYGIHVDGYLDLFALGEVLPVLTKTVYVEIGLAPSNEASPLLEGLKIVYEAA